MTIKFSSCRVLPALMLCWASFAAIGDASAAPPESTDAGTLADSAISGIGSSQIFQRDASNSARIYVRLNSPPAAATYKYYSISLTRLDENKRRVRSTVLAEGAYAGAQLLSFALPPQTDFQKVRVSFYNAANAERLRWDSPDFNVGEVFLVAGQSNAANHGDNEKNPLTASSKHRAVNPVNGAWQPLMDPMPYATAGGDGDAAGATDHQGSPWAPFADDLSAKLGGVPVAIVNVARGGTAIEWWQSGVTKATTPLRDQNGQPEVLFERLKLGANALKRLTAVDGQLKCDFRAVLWHQGESNAMRPFNGDPAQPSRTWYADKLKTLAQDFRTITGCAQPWMIASASWEAPHFYAENGLNADMKLAAEKEIRMGQRYIAIRSPLSGREPVFSAGPDTDLLAGDDPRRGGVKAYRWDGAHMTRQGLVMHGQLWSARVANMIDPVNHPLAAEYAASYEGRTVWGLYTNVLGRTPADMALDPEGFRFWVQALTMNPGRTGEANIQSDFEKSDERFVRDTYQSVVQRRPTWWELLYWLNELKSGRATRTTLAATDKVGYENTLGANGKRAFLLYVTVMGRSLQEVKNDAGGLANLTNALNTSQTSEAATTEVFHASAEYRVRSAFIKTKLRQPTFPELVTFVPKVTSATTPSDAVLENDVWLNAVN